jgi:hypothetical protein
MSIRSRSCPWLIATLVLVLIPAAASAQIASYSQDFETLDILSPDALNELGGADNWLVFGNVYAPDGVTYLYGYGAFVAPNNPPDDPAFSAVVSGQGGVEQGDQQLLVLSDYRNGDHAAFNIIESNVFKEWTITGANVGQTWIFEFDVKRGNIVDPSTALAFIKTIDPANGFAATNFLTFDTGSLPETWGTYSLSLAIDTSELVGQLFQIGFLNTATFYDASGMFYDNISLSPETSTDAPSGATARNVTLKQNYPNPFNPSTQIEFSLPEPGSVDLAIYDLAGRRVATLKQGALGAGDHSVEWNGRSDSGVPVASGNYLYMLRTSQGTVSRTMTLLK